MSALPSATDLRIAYLEAVSRTRPLTHEESARLERMLHRHGWSDLKLTVAPVLAEPAPPPARPASKLPLPAEEAQLAIFDGPLFDWNRKELAT